MAENRTGMQNICEYALDRFKKAGAHHAQCYITKSKTDELNVEAGKFSLLRTVFATNISLKAIVDGKKGTVVLNQSDNDSIDEAVQSCIAAAQGGVYDEAECVASVVENKHIDDSNTVRDMDAFYDRINEFVEETHERYPKVILESVNAHYVSGDCMYVSTNGVQLSNSYAHYNFSDMFSSKDGDQSSSFNHYGFKTRNLDSKFMDVGLTRATLEESERSIHTRGAGGKFDGTIIVSPAAMWWFMYAITMQLSDFSMINGTSIWKDALNTVISSEMLSICADPYADGVVRGNGVIMNDGYITEYIDVIKDGVLKNYLLSEYAARKTGKRRSSNIGWFASIKPGQRSLADIIKSVDRGVLVGRVSGAEPSSNGELSGVAKNSFLIENGKVTDALSETMISGNIADMIKNVHAISRETVNDGGGALPWIGFNGVTIS